VGRGSPPQDVVVITGIPRRHGSRPPWRRSCASGASAVVTGERRAVAPETLDLLREKGVEVLRGGGDGRRPAVRRAHRDHCGGRPLPLHLL